MKFYQIDQVKEDGKDFTMYIVADNVYDAFEYYRENWPNEIDQIVDFHLCEPFEFKLSKSVDRDGVFSLIEMKYDVHSRQSNEYIVGDIEDVINEMKENNVKLNYGFTVIHDYVCVAINEDDEHEIEIVNSK